MKLLDYEERLIVNDFEEQCPLLWNLMISIMTPPETIRQSDQFKDNRPAKGRKDAYFITNHIIKLIGGTALAARGAVLGIFLDTQGKF